MMFEAEQNQKTAFSLSEKLDWLRLTRTENVGPITFYRLIEHYGSAEKALNNLPDLARKGGRKKPLVAPDLSIIKREYEALQKLGGDIVCAGELAYPQALAATEDAPPVLSYIGNLDLVNKPCLAMVGARNASLNGRRYASKLAKELGQSGQIIVSGLARGIDTAAHEGAIDTGTITVVAGGIDIIYPRENTELYEQIKQHGLILAESPLGMQPIARHFPKRNRIVSGLSTGVVVIEAAFKSGSLITARLAGEQGRDVYAVPGYPQDPRAQGPNKLIQDGAILVQRSQDILNNISSFGGGTTLRDDTPQSDVNLYVVDDNAPQSEPENLYESVLENLSQMPVGVDELSRACHVTISALQIVLLEMELAGKLGRLSGNRVVLLDKEELEP